MSNVNPNVAFLNKAWAMLWDPTSNYYVPKILANGGTFGTVNIQPLQTLALDDMNDTPLYQSSTWGNVDISLTGMNLTGIPQVNGTGFTPSSDASQVTGTVTFSQLELTGAYEVDGSGIVGCAMDLGLEKIIPGGSSTKLTGQDDPPSNLSLASQYRDQLVNQGGNGITLVSTYYDQNDTLNTILDDTNAFTQAWQYAHPAGAGLDTKYFMGVTNVAGQNPADPNYNVGGDQYNTHSYYMQNTLLAFAIYKAGPNPPPENQYVQLQNSIVGFKGATMPNDQSQTVNNVMNTVQNTNAPASVEALMQVPETAIARKAREMAEKDYPMWEAKAAAKRAAEQAATTTYSSSGNFDFQFNNPTLTFNGTVAVGGISPNITLTVTITSLSSTIPNVNIVLLSGSDPTLTSDAQDHINNAAWFQTNIGVKVNAALNSTSLLSTFSSIFNQALINLLS
jgi:hypothetical protein